MSDSLTARAQAILAMTDAAAKSTASRTAAAAWRAGSLPLGAADPASLVRRAPDRPELRQPRDMPKRKAGASVAGRIALLHALAHIELNAIDLAWDIIARFGGDAAHDPPRGFIDDWVTVAEEEGKHFAMLSARLAELGAAYGDLPAHAGLWQASAETAHDLAARLAIVPLVLEARGLDVTPAMIADLTRNGDAASAAILQTIHDDEIGHVAVGKRWFDWVCQARGTEPRDTWQALVRRHFRGRLKPPFNRDSRDKAGFDWAWYGPLAEDG